MSDRDIANTLRRKTRSTRSTDSTIKLSHWLWENNVTPEQEGLKRSEIESEIGDELNHTVKTVLNHLVEANIIDEYTPPGPDTLVIAEWKDNGDGEVVNGEVAESAREGLYALSTEIESKSPTDGTTTAATDGGGETLRSVLAQELALVPGKVENFLRGTEKPVETLNSAVQAIKENDAVTVGEGYGEIVFINMPYRYRLTDEAVHLYER